MRLLGPDQRPAGEDEDERQEIEGQRDHPEQRDGRQVRGDVRGDAQHHARRNGGQGDPAQTPPHVDLVARAHDRGRFRFGAGGDPGRGARALLSIWLDPGGLARRLRGAGGDGRAGIGLRLRRQLRRRRRLGVGGVAGNLRSGRGPPYHADTHEHRADQQKKASRPDIGLRVKVERRLQHDRIGDQREQAAEVAGPVKEVRVLRSRVAGVGEPFLQ